MRLLVLLALAAASCDGYVDPEAQAGSSTLVLVLGLLALATALLANGRRPRH